MFGTPRPRSLVIGFAQNQILGQDRCRTPQVRKEPQEDQKKVHVYLHNCVMIRTIGSTGGFQKYGRPINAMVRTETV